MLPRTHAQPLQVLGIDSSAAAVALATRNAEINGLSSTTRFERAEAAAFMRAAREEGLQWDLVVLDPPKLAPNRWL